MAEQSNQVSMPREPSVAWLKAVVVEAGVWPEAHGMPTIIWQAVLRYHKAMVKVTEGGGASNG